MQSTTRLSVVVSALTFLLGLVFAVTVEAERTARTGGSTWLPFVSASPVLTTMIYHNVVLLIGFLISPVLVFLVGYVAGRGIPLRDEYARVLVALCIGSLLGYGIGRSVAVLVTIGGHGGAIIGIVLPATIFATARVSLVGFAGVAIGYLRSNRVRAS
ncbi:MAG: hypothetical protein ABEJ58_07610 [Halodesulfurarchaeum sp.]